MCKIHHYQKINMLLLSPVVAGNYIKKMKNIYQLFSNVIRVSVVEVTPIHQILMTGMLMILVSPLTMSEKI